MHEVERTLPTDRIDDLDISGNWYRREGCKTYRVEIVVPVPELRAPIAREALTYGEELDRHRAKTSQETASE